MGKRVASWEELRNDKIGLPGIITNFYIQKSNLIGVNGIGTSEILWRYITINNEIEGLLSVYIDEESEYWVKTAALKTYLLVPDFVKMPRNSGLVMTKLGEWNRLLSKEYAKLNLLLTLSRAAKI